MDKPKEKEVCVSLELLIQQGISKEVFFDLCKRNRFSNEELLKLYFKCYTNGFLQEFINLLDRGDPDFNTQLIRIGRDHPTKKNWKIVVNNLVLERYSPTELEELETMASSDFVSRKIKAFREEKLAYAEQAVC